jgi:hypothetical protein
MATLSNNKRESARFITPLDEIKDGQRFQQIVAELFRCLKTEGHNYTIADVSVMDSGIGQDGGCDILVDFVFEDIITEHKHRWVVECKCYEKSVGCKDINTNNIDIILNSKDADGYLLVCKKDASSSLKRLFDANNERKKKKYIVWNGDQLWHLCIQFQSLIKAFFPNYYFQYFVKDEPKFSKIVNNFEKEGGIIQ